jgi:hypothetical protein
MYKGRNVYHGHVYFCTEALSIEHAARVLNFVSKPVGLYIESFLRRLIVQGFLRQTSPSANLSLYGFVVRPDRNSLCELSLDRLYISLMSAK